MNISTAVTTAAIVAALLLPSTLSAQNVQLTWVDRTGKTIETVGPGANYVGLDLAPDGTRVAVHRHEGVFTSNELGQGDIVVFQTGSANAITLTSQRGESVDNTMPIWSPDGTRVVYGSTRNGKGGLYARRADGSGAEELLFESETSKVPMSWSPDGRYLVYWSPGDIQWILPLTGDRRPFQLSSSATSNAQISPDGKWVAYLLRGADADDEVFVKPFPRGEGRVRVSRNGGQFPRWSNDGTELFFLSGLTNGQLMAAPIAVKGSRIVAGTPSPLFESGSVYPTHAGRRHVFAVSRNRFLISRRAPPGPDAPNARPLTLFDRQGRNLGVFSEPVQGGQLMFAPDRTRVAMFRNDSTPGAEDVWVYDVATGKGAPLTSSAPRERRTNPVWSPDGRWIAYLVSKDDGQALYRRQSSGEGSEEHVHTFSGTNISLFEWTADGRYITYYSPQLGGNVVFALPLAGEPKPVEVVRSPFAMAHARLSPDNRFVAFRSTEVGKDRILVAPFDASGSNSNVEKVPVCPEGCTAPVYWSADGKELYYLSLDRGLMSVPVRAESTIAFGQPRLLFKVPDTFAAGAAIGGAMSMSRDGERFVIAVPRTPPPPAAAALNRMALLDGQGRSVQTIGEPGRFSNPVLSPDRSRVLIRKAAETGDGGELWAFDVATGTGTLVGRESSTSMIWSRDGRHVFYVVIRPGGVPAIVRAPADGSGGGETLYEYTAGAPLRVTDVTPDGRFLAFDSGGVIMLLPLAQGAAGKQEPLELLREEYIGFEAQFSPDGRTIAYITDETERNELYVQAFDPVSGKPVGRKRQVTTDGASSIVSWRADGRELYYAKEDLAGATLAKAVEVSTAARPAATPRFLFRASGPVSGDGQRFVATQK
jgi:Tol biopolymer transport system component